MDSTSTHKIQITDLPDAYKYTESLSPKWELFGNQLGISKWIMDVIDKDKKGCEEKLMELLARWLQQRGGEQQSKPSWRTLSEAARHVDPDIADVFATDHQCGCKECVDQMQQELIISPEPSSSMGGAEPNSPVDNKHIRNSSVCNNVRNQNVKEAFVALKKEFKQLGVFTSKEIAKVNPGKLRFLISDYMGDEWKDITVLEDHMRAIGKFDNPQEIFNYLRRYNLIGSINFDLLSVIQEAADSRLLDKRIEEYEKDYHCFLQLSLNDICTAYDNCPDLLKAYPVGLPKFIIYLKSEWGGRKTYEWKELLEGRFEWAKGINIVQIHKNCIVITYAVWPSMAKAVAYDLTNSDVLTDLKTVGVTRVDVSSRLLEFMQLKEEIKHCENFSSDEDADVQSLMKSQPSGEENEAKSFRTENNVCADSDSQIVTEVKAPEPAPINVGAKTIELMEYRQRIKELETELDEKGKKLSLFDKMNKEMHIEIDNARGGLRKVKHLEKSLQNLRNQRLQREEVILNLSSQLQRTRQKLFNDPKEFPDSLSEFEHKRINQLLLSAAKNGNESESEAFLKQGADPVYKDTDGFTALHLASSKGHVKVVKVLLLAGVDVDTKTDDGTTSLHRASYGGHIEVVNLLINNGASVEACTKNNATPLHRAASNNIPDVVQTLLSHGANIEAKTDAGSTSLHFASAGGHVEVVEVLISNGAFMEAQDMVNSTPLHRAATGGHTDTVNVLLHEGANLKATNTDTSTPLHKASEGGHSDVVEQLLSKQAPVGLQTNREQQTPLHLSTLFGHVRASKLLISHGASVSLKDKYGQTPALIAVALNNTEVIEHMQLNQKILPEDVEKYRLPSNWSASRDAFDGRIQYRNKMTGLRQYDHPAMSLMSGKS